MNEFNANSVRTSVSSSHQTRALLSLYNEQPVTSVWKVIAFFCENHTKVTNVLRARNWEDVNVKSRGI